jgi:hypothetical protein
MAGVEGLLAEIMVVSAKSPKRMGRKSIRPQREINSVAWCFEVGAQDDMEGRKCWKNSLIMRKSILTKNDAITQHK